MKAVIGFYFSIDTLITPLYWPLNQVLLRLAPHNLHPHTSGQLGLFSVVLAVVEPNGVQSEGNIARIGKHNPIRDCM